MTDAMYEVGESGSKLHIDLDYAIKKYNLHNS